MSNYEEIAEQYAELVDSKPIHIYYERPHTWSLLPNLKGLSVLDLGCGSGWYLEAMYEAGAKKVVAIDNSTKMLAFAKIRAHDQGELILADLNEPMDYLEAQQFDIVLAPLVIHYIKNWQILFKEIARVLKPKGLFVFSTHHPQAIYNSFQLSDYFQVQHIRDYWPSFKTEVAYYHHSLQELSENLFQAGFLIERLLEPLPLPMMEKAEPEVFEKISKQPWFLFGRAMRI